MPCLIASMMQSFHFPPKILKATRKPQDKSSSVFREYITWSVSCITSTTLGGFGTIQFWEKLRKYSYRIHRVIGLLYVFSILISSVSALILAFTTAYEVNWQFAFALQVWATAWISSTLLAYYHALRKRFLLHKEWMIRSYIVTIAFVIQGLLLKTSYVQSLGSLEEISASFIWMGWTVPLYLYEVLRSGQRMVRVT
jgi:hypothetical protein